MGILDHLFIWLLVPPTIYGIFIILSPPYEAGDLTFGDQMLLLFLLIYGIMLMIGLFTYLKKLISVIKKRFSKRIF